MKPGASSERAVILAPNGPRRRGRRRADQGGGLLRQCLRRSRRLVHGDRERRRPCGDRRRGDQDRGFARSGALAERSGVMVGFSDRVADASGRRSRAQSGRGAARPAARQRHFHRAPVSSDHAGRASSARRSAGGAASIRRAPFSQDLTESEGLLQTALNAGHLGALELHLPEFELEASEHLQGLFRPPAGRAVHLSGPAGVGSSRRSGTASATSWKQTIRTGKDYSIEYRVHLARRLAALGRRARARGARGRTAASNRWSASAPISPRARLPKSSARTCWTQLAAERTALAELTANAGAARRAAHRRSDEGSRGARKGPGAVAPGAEDGDDRPAHRRRRA